MRFIKLISISLVLFLSCNTEDKNKPLFTLLASSESGIEFYNTIVENQTINYFKFIQLYMGAGVAVGDINNDGLEDLYFNSNFGSNKLFLNQGDLKFKDITTEAGLDVKEGFRTGVSMVDINSDGNLDIYICRSGWYKDEFIKRNLLYINNGDLTFTESAAEYGIDDPYNSIHSSWFDYDKDGDVDLFLINTTTDFTFTKQMVDLEFIYSDTIFQRLKSHDKLYKNNGDGTFSDVSRKAGILPDIAFALGLVTVDFNQDGWTDIFVANDFISPDYLYINQGDGTFKEKSKDYLKHTSFYSMGADAGDINNDGLIDLMVLDMMPQDYKRSKTSMSMTDPETFDKSVEWGYNYQYMHNVLHLNSGLDRFQEIAQLSGVAKTDWSWSITLNDLNNDGYRDMYVTNGIKKMVTNQDFEKKIFEKFGKEQRQIRVEEMLNELPPGILSNYAYKNSGDLTFEDVTSIWGLKKDGISTGCIVADLDNDGDLDIVTNNSDEQAFIYENNARETENGNFLQLKLDAKNPSDILNTRITILSSDKSILGFEEFNPTRGYLSSQSSVIHFGLSPENDKVNVVLDWPNGQRSIIEHVRINERVQIDYSEIGKESPLQAAKNAPSVSLTDIINPVFHHTENVFDDYSKQILLPHKQSRWGPALASGDINGDGLEDFFVGGARGQAGAIYLQNVSGQFYKSTHLSINEDREYEDVDAIFVDIDNDNDLDLYVVSGGASAGPISSTYQDRLYLNNYGEFVKSEYVVPTIDQSGSVVSFADIDNDGDMDAFRGSRVLPEQYPQSPQSYLLINENGRLKDRTKSYFEDHGRVGMVTDAEWIDINNDSQVELSICGEWMGVHIYQLEDRALSLDNSLFSNSTGWWFDLHWVDIDSDGDQDLIGGNLGLNYKFHTSPESPFKLYSNDFDSDGVTDIVLATSYGDQYYPVRGRTCSSEQMPFISSKYPTFESFASADLIDIYGDSGIDSSFVYEADIFKTMLFINEADSFRAVDLPIEAQISPVMSILTADLNADNLPDILISGNLYESEVETTRADAGMGMILLNKGNYEFESVPGRASGFILANNVRKTDIVNVGKERVVLVANNNSEMECLTIPKL